MKINCAWKENAFVTKANIMHENVHSADVKYISKNKKVFTSVSVYNDDSPYYLYGVTDCLEFTKDKNGISLSGENDKYKIVIVEYKPKSPKDKEFNFDDLMQVFAQKLCVDYVFGGSCMAELYYADVKKRVRLPLQENYEEYDKCLCDILFEMRENIKNGRIPPKRKNQKCNGCSLKDICMPTGKKRVTLLEKIKNIQNANVEDDMI